MKNVSKGKIEKRNVKKIDSFQFVASESASLTYREQASALRILGNGTKRQFKMP
jgi:hypothetical protein